MKKPLFIVAHPDDTEVIFAHAVRACSEAHVLVATNGEASTIDLIGRTFVRGGNRRHESERSLGLLGVPLARQHYGRLHDGSLTDDVPRLAAVIADLAEQYNFEALISFGPDGFDGHVDHIAAYKAAAVAAKNLKMRHLIRTKDTAAEIEYDGNATVKTNAMRYHASQYDLTAENFWANMRVYQAQMDKEFYCPAKD